MLLKRGSAWTVLRSSQWLVQINPFPKKILHSNILTFTELSVLTSCWCYLYLNILKIEAKEAALHLNLGLFELAFSSTVTSKCSKLKLFKEILSTRANICLFTSNIGHRTMYFQWNKQLRVFFRNAVDDDPRCLMGCSG